MTGLFSSKPSVQAQKPAEIAPPPERSSERVTALAEAQRRKFFGAASGNPTGLGDNSGTSSVVRYLGAAGR